MRALVRVIAVAVFVSASMVGGAAAVPPLCEQLCYQNYKSCLNGPDPSVCEAQYSDCLLRCERP